MKNHLKFYRERKNISQSKLASELMVSRQTIIAIENNKYDPSLKMAYKIAMYFEISIEELFLFEEEIE
ncbi:helix-turn-helix transcriptional regulator [Cytobacillus kochii]